MIEKDNKKKSCPKKTGFDAFRSDTHHSGQNQRGIFLQEDFLRNIRQERVNSMDLPTSMEATRAIHIPTHHPQGNDPSYFTGRVRFGVETNKERQATATVRNIRQERVNYVDFPTSIEAARASHIPTHHPQGINPCHFPGRVRFGVETSKESQATATLRNIRQERVNYVDLPTSMEAARAIHIPTHHPQGNDPSHFTGRFRFHVETNKESQATATKMHVHYPKTRTKRMPDSEMRRILDSTLPLPRIPPQDSLAVVRITPSKPRVLKPWAPPAGHLPLLLGGQNLTQKRSGPINRQRNNTRDTAGMLVSDNQDQFKKPMGLLEQIKLLEAKSKETNNKLDKENRPVFKKFPREKLFKSTKEKEGNLECAIEKSREKLLDNVILFLDDILPNVAETTNYGLEPLSACSPRDESFDIISSISGPNSFSSSPHVLLDPLKASSLVPPLDLSSLSSDRSTELRKAEKELFISVLDDSEREKYRQTKIVRPEWVPRLDLSLLEESRVKTSKRIKAKKESERAANKEPLSLKASTRFLVPLGDFDLSANDKIFSNSQNSVAKMPFFFETTSVPTEQTPREAPVPVICNIKDIKAVPGNNKLRAKMAGTALLPDLHSKNRGNGIKNTALDSNLKKEKKISLQPLKLPKPRNLKVNQLRKNH